MRATASDTFLAALLQRLRRLVGDPLRIFAEGLGVDEKLTGRARISVGVMLFAAEMRRAELPVRAASTAYALLFALIPLFTTSIAFFTAFPGLGAERARIEQMLFTHLLPGAAQSAREYIEQFATRATAAGAVSSLVFFVVVLTLFKSIEETFNRVWKAERARSWPQRLTLLAVFFVVGGLAITAMVVVSAEASRLSQLYALDSSRIGVAFQQAAFAALGYASSITLFTIANKWLPNARVRWAPALVGGVIAGTLWHFLKDAFTWYVTDVASYENVYGAVAVLPVFLLWIYLTVLLVLMGGALAFVVQNHRTLIAERRMTSSRAPQHAWHAVSVLSMLARAFDAQKPPVSALELAQHLGVAQYAIAETVCPLVEAGVVLAIPAGTEQRYALGVPADKLTLGRVVVFIIGEDFGLLDITSEVIVPLCARVAVAFAEARTTEGNVLERVTIADLAHAAPSAAPSKA
jgi:YihY family inner membrane protein